MPLILLLLLYSFVASSQDKPLKAKERMFSTCKVFDKKETLLKCSQIERTPYYHHGKFRLDCVSDKSKKFDAYGLCPKSKAIYQCEALGHLTKVKASNYYYYPMKDSRKIKSQCLHDFKNWKNHDLNSKEFNFFNKTNFKKVSCLKFQNFQLKSCQQYDISKGEQAWKLYDICQTNHINNMYYQFLFNVPCPQKDLKFVCNIKGENGLAGLHYYRNYNNINMDTLRHYCYSLQNNKNEFLQKVRLITKDIKKIQCTLKNKKQISYCHEFDGLNRDFEKDIQSCYDLLRRPGEKIDLQFNQNCPRKSQYMCKREGETSFIYSGEKRALQRLKQLCSRNKGDWIKAHY